MESIIEKDRVVIFAPVDAPMVAYALAFLTALISVFWMPNYILYCVPFMLLFLIAFLVSLWEVLHPLVFDKNGVEAYFFFFTKKCYGWDEISEVVLCMTHRVGASKHGPSRVPAIGIQSEDSKKYIFACPELSEIPYSQLIDAINNLAGRDIVVDSGDSLVESYSRGTMATRISGVLLLLLVVYITVLIIIGFSSGIFF